MSMNTVLIILILLAMGGALYWYLRKTELIDDTEQFDDFLTKDRLSDMVIETFAAYTRKNVNEMNLSQEEYNKINEGKEDLKFALRTAPYGDKNSKYYIVSFMQDIFQNKNMGKINNYTILKVIPFDHPEEMTSRERFEVLVFRWLKEGSHGFSKNFSFYGLDQPKETEYGDVYVVTEEDISRVYEQYEEDHGKISYREQLEFLVQYTYEATYGLGAIDLLLETDVDEVQGGTSGIPADSYDIEVEDMENVSFSFESIWIVYKGLNIHLKCTTFGTQAELVRVTKNVCRYDAPAILTQNDAGIIGSMKNGNRVTAFQPSFTDSYGFMVRKFDSAPSLAPELLLVPEPESE